MGLRRDVGRPWRYRTSGGAQRIPDESDPSSSSSDTPCSRPTALHRLLPTDCPPSSRLNARLACGIARRAADRALYLLPFPIRERRGPESTEVEGGGSAPRRSLPLANDLASPRVHSQRRPAQHSHYYHLASPSYDPSSPVDCHWKAPADFYEQVHQLALGGRQDLQVSCASSEW